METTSAHKAGASESPNSFRKMLRVNGLNLTRAETTALQINVGLLCNQLCNHCHLDAGPGRKEIMVRQTMDQIMDYAARNRFKTIDITGGAPELVPDIEYLLKSAASISPETIIRANLTALLLKGESFTALLKKLGVTIVASFPSLNVTQAESLRGRGIFQESIDALRQLNRLGYGHPDSPLELNLVANPSGAYLPPDQKELETRFKSVLKKKWDISFNQLYSFANVPLGRFKSWLIRNGRYREYLERLASAFNPSTLEGVMCRNMVSVSWDGYLYDCDFNLAAGLPHGGNKNHVCKASGLPKLGEPIKVDDHCYTCTAGAGFT